MMLSLATPERQQPPWTISTTGKGPLPSGSHRSATCKGPGPYAIRSVAAGIGRPSRSGQSISLAVGGCALAPPTSPKAAASPARWASRQPIRRSRSRLTGMLELPPLGGHCRPGRRGDVGWRRHNRSFAMAIRGIDHINIGTDRLDETKAFFRDVLGLTEG